MKFFGQEYWSGLPFPSPGDLPDPGIKPRSPILQVYSLLSAPPGKPHNVKYMFLKITMLWNIVQKKNTGLVGEMRLRAQHSIPKLNTVVNKTTTTTFMKSVMLFFYTFSGGSVVKNLPAMQEMQVWSLGQEDPLKKEMAIHSSILAWEIQWTMVPGGLQSMKSQESDMDLPSKWSSSLISVNYCSSKANFEKTLLCFSLHN